MNYGLISITPTTSPVKLDIMQGDMYKGTISFPCVVGIEYGYEELKAFARIRRPSLEGKDFDVFVCGKPKFMD